MPRKTARASRQPAVPMRARLEAAWWSPLAPWIVLATLTALAYANAVHDVLISDDREFLASGQFGQLSPRDYLALFSQSVWEGSGAQSNLYRPLLLVAFGFETALFGDWAGGYHLVNVLLHIAATLLVFGLVRQVLYSLGFPARQALVSAFLGALVFGVHPVRAEVVNLAFNGSELYVTIGIAGGLWFLLANLDQRPVRAWGLLSVVYLVTLLFRESAVSLPALAVLVLLLARRAPWPTRLKSCLPALVLVLPLALYLALRANALEPADATGADTPQTAGAPSSEPVRLALYQPPVRFLTGPADAPPRAAPEPLLNVFGLNLELSRVSLAASTWFDALRLMVWPHPLVSLREVSVTPFWLALVTQLALLALAIVRFAKGSPAPLLGLLLFYAAILPSSRIVSDSFLPPLLLDRMLYLPAVGLVICLSSILLWIGTTLSTRAAVLGTALTVLVLLPVTWQRNQAWGNELELLEHDFSHEPRNGQLLSSLIRAKSRAGRIADSIRLCEQNAEAVSATLLLSHDCAMIYSSAGLHDRAEAQFRHSLELDPGSAWDHFELARLYVRADQRERALAHFASALRNENMPFIREIMQAIMQIELHPQDAVARRKAREHVERALELQPRSVHARELMGQLDEQQTR